MEAAGIEVSALGVAKMYADVCSNIIIDTKDRMLTKKIESLNINVHDTKIRMTNKQSEDALAASILKHYSIIELKISAIIPVKTFSKAKKRLNLQQAVKENICNLMLQEVLKTVNNCKLVNKIVLVSKDETALKIGRQFDAIEIFDNESGVNDAVSLADQYISDKKFDCSSYLSTGYTNNDVFRYR